MANYTNLKNIIDQYINTNGQGDITGAILNDVLKNIVDSIGADFLFAGVAEPTTNPGSPDQNIFYIAITGGTYTNFGNVVIPNGITIFKWNGSWSYQILFDSDDALLMSNANAKEIGARYASLVESASSLVYKTIMTDLGITQGEGFTFKITGEHSGNRILLKYNSTSGATIQDFCVIGTTYFKVADTSLNSIVLYHNGDINISLEVDKNIKYQTQKNAADISSLTTSLNNMVTDVSELNEEVLNEKVSLIDFTGSAPVEQYVDFFVTAGTECTVKIHSLSAQSTNIYAVGGLNNIIETIHTGVLTAGQVVTHTFTPSSNVYKVRLNAASRGKLEVITINESLKDNIKNTTDALDTRLTAIEDVVDGVGMYEEIDVSEYDMENENIDINISGSAYSVVKFHVDNPSVANINVKLYYRKTNQSSVELGILSVSNKGNNEVIYEIPEDFVSVRYARYNSQHVIVDVTTVLNPTINDNIAEKAISSNVLNVNTLTEGHALNPSTGADSTWTTMSYTDYIAVKEGDVVVVSNDVATLIMPNTNGKPHNPRPLEMRYIAAFDYNKSLLGSLGSNPSVAYTKFTVPKGVYYIRITALTTTLKGDGARINRGGVILPYEPYWKGCRPTGVTENIQRISLIKNFTLSTLPDYIVNSLSYKPLGALSKGYLCVSDDDGTIGLGTYTLPMIISKEVPVTFSLMKTSAIFQEGNEQYKELLLDSVRNYGCSIAQHGGVNWTEYNEKQLYDFFNDEKDYWDSLDITVKSAVIPSHYVNKTIEAVAGGYFGVVRCGYNAYDGSGQVNNESIHTDNYACIPRTNIYCLPSLNVRDKTLQQWQSIIDWVVDNKLLLCVYFHDVDFVETATDYQIRRTLLEGFLDYAKDHITMINIEDIPRIV